MADKTPRLTPEEFMLCAKNIPNSTGVEKAAEPWVFGSKLLDAQLAKAKPYYIEKGKQMEREKILIEFDNMLYLAPQDDAYLRILVGHLRKAIEVGKWAKAELGTPLVAFKEGKDV